MTRVTIPIFDNAQPNISNLLLIFMNLHQNAKNQTNSSVCSGDIVCPVIWLAESILTHISGTRFFFPNMEFVQEYHKLSPHKKFWLLVKRPISNINIISKLVQPFEPPSNFNITFTYTENFQKNTSQWLFLDIWRSSEIIIVFQKFRW